MSANRNGSGDFHEGENNPSPVSRVFVTGYYDGPTNGVLQLGLDGPVYLFEQRDEDVVSPDMRTYDLRRLPRETLARITDLLAPYHTPTWPVWCPKWTFPTECAKAEVEEGLDLLLETPGPYVWEIETADWFEFSNVTAHSSQLVLN
jgi:hypothetical protein